MQHPYVRFAALVLLVRAVHWLAWIAYEGQAHVLVRRDRALALHVFPKAFDPEDLLLFAYGLSEYVNIIRLSEMSVDRREDSLIAGLQKQVERLNSVLSVVRWDDPAFAFCNQGAGEQHVRFVGGQENGLGPSGP